MKKLAVFTLALMATIGVVKSNAQDTEAFKHSVKLSIPEVALLDLEGGFSGIVLAPTAPTEAGEALDFSSATDNGTWMNYSSVVAAGLSRKVSVQITNGVVPDGLTLTVEAGADAGQGNGVKGTASSTITLSTTPQNIVSSVGSCWTGNGASKGRNLTYALALSSDDSYGLLDFEDDDIEITYTILDDE